MRWWPEPTAGEIVWCHFPDNIHPKPKPRPGLIVSTKVDDEGILPQRESLRGRLLRCSLLPETLT